MLDSPDPVVRAYGIAGMAEPNPIDDSHDSQLLAKCITTDADPRVRALAILWTSMRNGPALVAARHVAKADPDPMVQQALFQIQGRGLDIAVDPTSENLGHTSPRQVPRHKDWPLVESRGQGRRILPPRWSPEGMQWPFGNG
jgi:hypothetical protein